MSNIGGRVPDDYRLLPGTAPMVHSHTQNVAPQTHPNRAGIAPQTHAAPQSQNSASAPSHNPTGNVVWTLMPPEGVHFVPGEGMSIRFEFPQGMEEQMFMLIMQQLQSQLGESVQKRNGMTLPAPPADLVSQAAGEKLETDTK